MVPLRILTLVFAGPEHPSILVLEPIEETPSGKARIIPIWIGPVEATQIGIALEKVKLPRPTSHDLFLDALTNLDTHIDHVLFNNNKGRTFFTRLTLKQGNRLIDLDARPTDALSLAFRQDAPIYIDEEVLERASFPYIFKKNKIDETELRQFKDFISSLSPDDFV